jgi:hypothetical protein
LHKLAERERGSANLIFSEGSPLHKIVRIGYLVRSTAFAYSFLVVGLHLWERGTGPLAYVLLALQFLVYPQLVTLVARQVGNAKEFELRSQYVDAFLLGAWIAGLGFPTWIAFGASFSTTLNAAVSRGLAGAGCSLALFCLGMLAWAVPAGFTYWGATSSLVTALCFFGSLAYATAIGSVVYRRTRERPS